MRSGEPRIPIETDRTDLPVLGAPGLMGIRRAAERYYPTVHHQRDARFERKFSVLDALHNRIERLDRLARTESTRSTHMIDVKTKFITVEIFTLEPADLPEFAREATLAMQSKAPSRPGFIEGIVMAEESQRQALIVTQWESRCDWVGAEWDEEIGRTLGDLVEGTKDFDFRSYEPITIVRASRPGTASTS